MELSEDFSDEITGEIPRITFLRYSQKELLKQSPAGWNYRIKFWNLSYEGISGVISDGFFEEVSYEFPRGMLGWKF